MKKIFLLLFLPLFSTQAFSQEIGLGIKAGGDISQIKGVSWNDDFSTFLTTGAFAYVRPLNSLALRVELNFNQLRTTTKSGFSSTFLHYLRDPSAREADFRFLEMGIPVLLEYRLIKPFTLETGVQFNSIINVNDYDDIITDKKNFFEKSYMSWVFGAQLFLSRRLSVNARYVHGLQNINNTDVRERWRVGRYQFSLQYHLIRWGD